VQTATEYMLSKESEAKKLILETEGSGLKNFGFEQSGEETEPTKVKFEEEVQLREN
jgi:hypothetical protein